MAAPASTLPTAGKLTAKVAKYVFKHDVCLRIGAIKQGVGSVNSAYAMALDVLDSAGQKDVSKRTAMMLTQLQFEGGVLNTMETAELRAAWERMLDETLELICGYENAPTQRILLISGGRPGAADYKGCFPKVMNLPKTAPVIAETTFAAVPTQQALEAWIFAELARLADAEAQ